MLKIAENIFRKRKEKNITQEELADYMMVTKASVSKWETGQSYPDILLLPKLATYFNITVDELIGYEPQLSIEQIQKIYENLLNDVTKENLEDTMNKAKAIAHQYYSCFELLYYIGVFIINHITLIENETKIKEYVEYAEGLFKRIYGETDNTILMNKALNMRGVCLLQLNKANEVIELLPSSDYLFTSTDCLVASAYFQIKDIEEVDKQLQVFIYKNITDLITFLTMKSTLNIDDWKETSKRIENLIDSFHLSELNISLVLNFYLSIAIKYNQANELSMSKQYIEKYLTILLENKKYTLEIKGDQYFNKIDEWIDQYLMLGSRPIRNKKSVYLSFLNAVTNNPLLKNILICDDIQSLIQKLKEKIEEY